MTHIITREKFLAYARTKSGTYDYTDNRNCAMAQYGRDVLGIANPYASAAGIETTSGSEILATYSQEDISEEELNYHDDNTTWEGLVKILEALS